MGNKGFNQICFVHTPTNKETVDIFTNVQAIVSSGSESLSALGVVSILRNLFL